MIWKEVMECNLKLGLMMNLLQNGLNPNLMWVVPGWLRKLDFHSSLDFSMLR